MGKRYGGCGKWHMAYGRGHIGKRIRH